MRLSRTVWRWAGPVLTIGVLAGITAMAVRKPAPELEPVVTCGRFQILVPGDEDLTQARQLMHRASIEFLADFHDELPRWGLRSTIQLQQPITFSLISHPRIGAEGYELVLLHRGGGQVKRPDIHSDECRNDTGIKAFARLRDLMLQRWPQPQQVSAPAGTDAR